MWWWFVEILSMFQRSCATKKLQGCLNIFEVASVLFRSCSRTKCMIYDLSYGIETSVIFFPGSTKDSRVIALAWKEDQQTLHRNCFRMFEIEIYYFQ